MSQTDKRRYSVLGKQIVTDLINKDMTVKQLADAIGTSPQYLNKIIHGERSGEKYMAAIKDILDIMV